MEPKRFILDSLFLELRRFILSGLSTLELLDVCPKILGIMEPWNLEDLFWVVCLRNL